MLIGSLLTVAVVIGLTVTIQALLARNNLEQAKSSAITLETAIADGNKALAAKSLDQLQSSASSAHGHTNGPLWKLGTFVPFIGDDVHAIRTVASVLDSVSADALPPVVDISTELNLNRFSPKNGKLDLKELAKLNAPIKKIDSSLAQQATALDSIDLSSLSRPARGPVTLLVDKINGAADAARIANDALKLIPTMLGDQKRNYLIVFQNNAEIRATGGLPGSYLIAHVDNGKITRGKQGTGSGFGALPSPAIKLTKEEKQVYTDNLAKYFIDSNLTPEFPRTAQIMKAIIKSETGTTVDGVISLDPIAMSYLLAGTGPVTLTDGTVLTAQNAVSELLNKAYLRFPKQNGSDDFFEDAAAKLFDYVTDGHGDAGKTIRGFVRAAKEQRIYLWSDKTGEQAKLSSMAVAGLLKPDADETPTLGVYLNDGTGTKLEYYLRYATNVRSLQCLNDGTQIVEARIDLASYAPKDAAKLPQSIVTDAYGVKKGNMVVNTRFYLPTGGNLLSAKTDRTKLATTTRRHKGHDVLSIPSELAPGDRTWIDIVFRTGPAQTQTIHVRSTPSVQSGVQVKVSPSACSSN